jgi:polypeptide N-acetylgalactosaminyltransferase
LIRATKREGLIRARLKGAAVAKGEVLVFLDSHCECAEGFTIYVFSVLEAQLGNLISNISDIKLGWLEPLIDPIARNHNVSTVPLIEIIDDNTFQLYSTAIESIQVGGFDWNLIFDWHPVPRNEMDRRKKKTDPIRSPTMAGAIFIFHII